MTIVESVELGLGLDISNLNRQMAEIRQQMAQEIMIPVALDHRQLNQQLEEIRSRIKPIKVDLAPDVDDFNRKLERVGRLAPEIKVKVSLDVESLNLGAIKIPKLDLSVKVNHQPLTELNKHLDRKKSHVQELQRYFNQNPLTVSGKISKVSETASKASSNNENRGAKLETSDTIVSKFIPLVHGLSGDITKALDSVRRSIPKDNIFSSIFRGLTERIGQELIRKPAQQFATGVGNVGKDFIAQNFGDLSLVGESLTKELIASVTIALLDNKFTAPIFQSASKMFAEIGKGIAESIEQNIGKETLTLAKGKQYREKKHATQKLVDEGREGTIRFYRDSQSKAQELQQQAQYQKDVVRPEAIRKQQVYQVARQSFEKGQATPQFDQMRQELAMRSKKITDNYLAKGKQIKEALEKAKGEGDQDAIAKQEAALVNWLTKDAQRREQSVKSIEDWLVFLKDDKNQEEITKITTEMTSAFLKGGVVEVAQFFQEQGVKESLQKKEAELIAKLQSVVDQPGAKPQQIAGATAQYQSELGQAQQEALQQIEAIRSGQGDDATIQLVVKLRETFAKMSKANAPNQALADIAGQVTAKKEAFESISNEIKSLMDQARDFTKEGNKEASDAIVVKVAELLPQKQSLVIELKDLATQQQTLLDNQDAAIAQFTQLQAIQKQIAKKLGVIKKFKKVASDAKKEGKTDVMKDALTQVIKLESDIKALNESQQSGAIEILSSPDVASFLNLGQLQSVNSQAVGAYIAKIKGLDALIKKAKGVAINAKESGDQKGLDEQVKKLEEYVKKRAELVAEYKSVAERSSELGIPSQQEYSMIQSGIKGFSKPLQQKQEEAKQVENRAKFTEKTKMAQASEAKKAATEASKFIVAETKKYPVVIQNILEDLTGQQIPEIDLPKIEPLSDQASPQALGSYHAPSNVLQIRKELLAKLQNQQQLTVEELTTLYHELDHYEVFDKGQFQGIKKAMARSIPLSDVPDPSAIPEKDLPKVYSHLRSGLYDPEDVPHETRAYAMQYKKERELQRKLAIQQQITTATAQKPQSPLNIPLSAQPQKELVPVELQRAKQEQKQVLGNEPQVPVSFSKPELPEIEIGKILQESLQSISTGVDDIFKAETTDDILQQIEIIKNSHKEAFSAFKEAIKNKEMNMASGYGSTMLETLNYAQEDIKQLYEQVADSDPTKQMLLSLLGNIGKWKKTVTKEMVGVRKAVVDGIALPNQSAVGEDLAKTIIEGAKEEFGIHSPAEKFIEMGEQIVAGTAIGVEGIKEAIQIPIAESVVVAQEALKQLENEVAIPTIQTDEIDQELNKLKASLKQEKKLGNSQIDEIDQELNELKAGLNPSSIDQELNELKSNIEILGKIKPINTRLEDEKINQQLKELENSLEKEGKGQVDDDSIFPKAINDRVAQLEREMSSTRKMRFVEYDSKLAQEIELGKSSQQKPQAKGKPTAESKLIQELKQSASGTKEIETFSDVLKSLEQIDIIESAKAEIKSLADDLISFSETTKEATKEIDDQISRENAQARESAHDAQILINEVKKTTGIEPESTVADALDPTATRKQLKRILGQAIDAGDSEMTDSIADQLIDNYDDAIGLAEQQINSGKSSGLFETVGAEFSGFYKQITEKFPILGKIATGIKGAFTAFVGVSIFQNLSNSLIQLGSASLETARKLEDTSLIYKFAFGNFAIGQQQMRFVADYAKSQNNPMMEAIEGYSRLAAEAKGTTLEGQGTRDIFTAISNAASVLSLDKQQTGNAFLAVQQAIGKGTVQSQELKLQLAGALSGLNVIGTSAQAMGVSVQEFNKMMEQGLVRSEDWAAKFAPAVNSAVAIATEESANTMLSALNKVDNAVLELQGTFGKALQPIQKPLLMLQGDLILLAKNILPEITFGATLMATAFVVGGVQGIMAIAAMKTAMIAFKTVVKASLTAIKQFFIQLNQSIYAQVAGGLLLAGMLIYRGYKSIYTEEVDAMRKTADEAERIADRLADARAKVLGQSKEESTKPQKQSSFMGGIQDFFTQEQEGIGGFAKKFTFPLTLAAGVFDNINKANTWTFGERDAEGNRRYEATTWADLSEQQRQIAGYNSADAQSRQQFKAISLLKLFENREGSLAQYDAIDAKTRQAEAKKLSLQTYIDTEFVAKGIIIPAEYKTKLQNVTAEITKLAQERQGVIDPLSRSKQAIDDQISAYKNTLADSTLEASERQRTQAMLANAERISAAYEEALSVPSAILQLQYAFEVLTYKIQESTIAAERLRDANQAIISQQQLQGFRSNYFSNEDSSIASAKTEETFNQQQLESMRSVVAQGEALLNDPRIKQFGFTSDISTAEIDRTLASVTDTGTKILLEKIKEYKQLEKQLPQLEKGLAQSQLQTKQAIETASMAKIQKNIDDLRARLTINYNREIQDIRQGLINSQVEQESVGYAIAQSEFRKASDERRITQRQLTAIKLAYRKGEISRKTYEDRLRELNTQLAEQTTGVVNAEIAVQDALKAEYQAEITAGNQQFESVNNTAISARKTAITQQQLQGLKDAKTVDVELAQLEQQRIANSIVGTKYQLAQNQFLYDEKLIGDREYTTQRLQLEAQLADLGTQSVQQQMAVDEAVRQRKIYLIDLEISKINLLVQSHSRSLEKLEKELELKIKSLDLDKQLIDSRQKLDQALSQQTISSLESQLNLAQKAVELFEQVKSDNRLFKGFDFAKTLTPAQLQAVRNYEDILAKQTGIAPNQIEHLKRNKDEEWAKIKLLNIELGLLDYQFKLENDIADKKLEALKLEQKYQNQLLQIDLERTKLQSQQAVFTAQKSQITARGEINTAQKELEKAGLIRDPLEREKAQLEALGRLENAEQLLDVANKEVEFAGRNLAIQDELAKNAILAQEAQQQSAEAQEKAAQFARQQSQELERAKRTLDAMLPQNENEGKQEGSVTRRSLRSRRISGFEANIGAENEQRIFDAIGGKTNFRKVDQGSPIRDIIDRFSYGKKDSFSEAENGYNQNNLDGQIASESQSSQKAIKDGFDGIDNNLSRIASRPTNLYVSSSNPTSDAAQIYNDLGKVASRSNNL